MTSVLAATAFDPIKNQPYGLMGSDSQGELEQEDGTFTTDYSTKKILISRDGLRLTGHAGTCLNDPESYYSGHMKNQIRLLDRFNNPTKEQLETIAKNINKSWTEEGEETDFLFLDYSNGQINLHKYSNKFSPNIKAEKIGSGEKYIGEKFTELTSKYLKNRIIVCPFEELSQIFIQTLNHASKDKSTGGSISLGIQTSKQTILIDRFSKIKKEAREKDARNAYNETSKKVIAEVARKYPSVKGIQLEDLVFA